MPDGAPSPTQPAPSAPPADPPQGGQPPAPIPTPPADGQQPPANDNQPPANGGDKTFTQADVDRLITERLQRDRESQRKQWAAALGIEDPEAAKDPAKLLEASQRETVDTRAELHNTWAETLAEKAGIKPERVETFLQLVDLKGVLKDVDLNDRAKVKAAIKATVDANAERYPEWKAGAALPPASGGDRQQNNGNGKRIYTRAELAQMSQSELAKNASDLIAAQREGRIK